MTESPVMGERQAEGGNPADGSARQPTYRLGLALREDWPLLVLFALAFAAAAWIYPTLPERMPIHWDMHGNVNGWGSRLGATFGMLGMFLGIYALMVLLPIVDPRRANYAKFLPTYRIIRWLTVFVVLSIWAFATAATRHAKIRIDVIVPVTVSLVFVVLGNIMGRLRHNWFVGIRTPWSLANEEAWRLTHRAAGPAWVIGGLIGLTGALVGGAVGVATLLAGTLGAALFSVVYSYFAYKRSLRAGGPSRASGA
jgi:uncharacterized membrane protein